MKRRVGKIFEMRMVNTFLKRLTFGELKIWWEKEKENGEEKGGKFRGDRKSSWPRKRPKIKQP